MKYARRQQTKVNINLEQYNEILKIFDRYGYNDNKEWFLEDIKRGIIIISNQEIGIIEFEVEGKKIIINEIGHHKIISYDHKKRIKE